MQNQSCGFKFRIMPITCHIPISIEGSHNVMDGEKLVLVPSLLVQRWLAEEQLTTISPTSPYSSQSTPNSSASTKASICSRQCLTPRLPKLSSNTVHLNLYQLKKVIWKIEELLTWDTNLVRQASLGTSTVYVSWFDPSHAFLSLPLHLKKCLIWSVKLIDMMLLYNVYKAEFWKF